MLAAEPAPHRLSLFPRLGARFSRCQGARPLSVSCAAWPQTGRHLLATPDFLKRWLADAGLRGVTPPAAQAAGAPQGFQAFRGTGRRLAD